MITREKIVHYFLHVGVFGLVLTPFVFGGGLYLANSTWKLITWCTAIICLLLGVWFLPRAEQRKILAEYIHPLSLILFLFVGWLTVRSFFSWNHLVWWGSWTRTDGLWMWWSLWVLWPILRWYAQEEEKIWRAALLMFVVLAIGTTVLQPLLSATFLPDFFPVGRPVGFVGNAVYLALVLIFVPWAATETFLKEKWQWLTAVLLIVGALIFYTETRSVILGLAVAGIWFLFDWFFSHKKINQRQIIGVAAMVIILVGGFLASGKFVNDRLQNWLETSAKTRLVLWHSVAPDIKHRPFIGYGVGNEIKILDSHVVDVVAQNYAESNFDTTHSAYLDLWLQGGLVAVLLCLLFLVTAIYFLPNTWQRATVVFYVVALATTFFNPWSNILLLMLLVGARSATKEFFSTTKIFFGVGVIGSVAVLVTAVLTLSTVPYHAYQLNKIVALGKSGASIQQFVERAQNISGWMPFSVERDLEIMRSSVALWQKTISFLAWDDLTKLVVPLYNQIVVRTDLSARDYWDCGIFSASYAKMTAEKIIWQDRAENILRVGREKYLGFPPLTYDLAGLLVEREQTAVAIELLQEYTQSYPLIPDSFYYLARFQFLAGQKEAARLNITHAFEDFPGWVWSDSNRTIYQQILGTNK